MMERIEKLRSEHAKTNDALCNGVCLPFVATVNEGGIGHQTSQQNHHTNSHNHTTHTTEEARQSYTPCWHRCHTMTHAPTDKESTADRKQQINEAFPHSNEANTGSGKLATTKIGIAGGSRLGSSSLLKKVKGWRETYTTFNYTRRLLFIKSSQFTCRTFRLECYGGHTRKMIVFSDFWLSDFAISGSSTVPGVLKFAQSSKSVRSLCTSAAAIEVILGSPAALGDPCFSSFILSRTGTWSVRDKIKSEKKMAST